MSASLIFKGAALEGLSNRGGYLPDFTVLGLGLKVGVYIGVGLVLLWYCRNVIGRTKGTLELTFLGSEEEEIVVQTTIQHLTNIISTPR